MGIRYCSCELLGTSRQLRGHSAVTAAGEFPGISGPAAGAGSFGLGGFAGFQSDRVRGHGSGPQGRGQACDDMLMGQVTPQQGDFDQSPGAVPLTMRLAGLVPPGIRDRSEPACRTGLFEGCGAGERARLAYQEFQAVVVQTMSLFNAATIE